MRTRRQQQQQRDAQATNAFTAEAATVTPPLVTTLSDGASGDSDAHSCSSDEKSDAPASTQTQRKQIQSHRQHSQPRAAWNDETLVCLLQLRYVEMDAHFRNDCVTSAELADAWCVLANELNLRMEVAFSSLQCRARISALRKRWDENSIANIREGTEQRTKHVGTIKLLTWLYRKRVVVPLKQVKKIAPRVDCRGHKRFAEGVSDTESECSGDERETWWLMQKIQQREEDTTSLDGGDDCEQFQADDAAGTNADSAVLSNGNLPLTLERRHLELFRRQVVAEETIAECSLAQVEAVKQRIRAEREQLRLARDELELKLFTMAAFEPEEVENEDDCVTYEFVVMKRKQVADRLTREVEREERRKELQSAPRQRSKRRARTRSR